MKHPTDKVFNILTVKFVTLHRFSIAYTCDIVREWEIYYRVLCKLNIEIWNVCDLSFKIYEQKYVNIGTKLFGPVFQRFILKDSSTMDIELV